MTTEREIDDARRKLSDEFRADIEDFLPLVGRAGKIDLIDEIALWPCDDSTS